MNLKSLRYGVQHGAQYGARLTEKYCRGASFIWRRTRTPNVCKIPNSSSPEIDIKNCFIPIISCLNSDQIV